MASAGPPPLPRGHHKLIALGAVGLALIIAALATVSIVENVTLKPCRIYVVGDMSGGGTEAAVRNAIESDRRLAAGIGGIPIKVVALDDHGRKDDAADIARAIAKKGDALMVIGHFSSTETKAALPYYLRASPPIPDILVSETNPQLLPAGLRGGSAYADPILRLSPNDNKQGWDAADFACRQGATTFWVVQDVSNPVYSSYLARRFIHVIEADRHSATNRVKGVLLWSNNMQTPSPAAIQALHIDWVFFAGGWENALILIRQLRSIYGDKMPSVILTDAAATNDLITYGGPDVNGVYVEYPFSYTEVQAMAERKRDPYAADTRAIVNQLIGRANSHFSQLAASVGGWGYRLRRLLGIRSTADARRALIALIAQVTAPLPPHQDPSPAREFAMPDGRTWWFGPGGNREDGFSDFHIWQVEHGKFVDMPADEMPNRMQPCVGLD